MAIELITGVGANNHISSNDFRAFNRANFGQGRYILKDDDDMNVVVSAPTGNISISAGSCLWSGMHIRNASTENLSYTVPVSTQNVYVWLHYKKEAVTGIESVEFVVTVETEMSPVMDNMNDNTTEAYTLFCSFTANASTASAITYYFTFARNFEEVEKLVDNLHSETVLFQGNASANSQIQLSESFENFYEICFVSSSGRYQMLTSLIPKTGRNLGIITTGAGKWNNTTGGFADLCYCIMTVISDNQFKVLLTGRALIESSVQASDPPSITAIIGIGRKIK